MGGNTAPKDNKARLLNALNDTRNLLDHISKHTNHRTPPRLYEYLKQIRELTEDLIKHPVADLRAEFAELRQETLEMRRDLVAVKAATDKQLALSMGPSRMSTASWADALRKTPAPAHHLSPPGSRLASSATAVSPPELSINRWRRKIPAQVTVEADGLRAKAARTAGSEPLAAVTILATRQLG